MVRAVASRRAERRNEDLAIVTIHPLPGNVLDFGAVDEVLTEFFQLRRIVITDIQPCCLGQAYVRFDRALDRDILVNQGPIAFDNIFLTFVNYNEGRNWRRVHFNTECWIMLMGFPPHYQEEFYQSAISSFGRFMFLQEEERRLTRVIIRARVMDLQSIPHFIVFESEGFESDSWTVQCEILQHNLLGGGP